MARKTSTFVVSSEGRDKGKTFLLTEMAATKAEDWAIRVMLALGHANVELPDGALQLGMASLAEIGLKKLFAVNAADIKPLLAELMECVEFIPNPQKPQVKLGYPMYESQVEEVSTLLELRRAIFELHTSFLQSAAPSAQTAPSTMTTEASPGRIRRTRPAR